VATGANPISYLAPDGGPLVELKQGLVLYLKHPPNPDRARIVYDHYLSHCGNRVRAYRSTYRVAPEVEWNLRSRQEFETLKLPNLRQANHWGYAFHDGRTFDSWLFMFHGYRPHTEAGRTSFLRYDFDWQVDPGFLQAFARELIGLVPCLSGFAGYYFQGRLAYNISSFNRMYALARRYWGVEAHSLDVSVKYLLAGYKCVNWLTIIGDELRTAHPAVLGQARNAAFAYHDTPNATLLQAQLLPALGDRHRRERLPGYEAVAGALLPLQITEHAPFGGEWWDEDNTIRYIRRFTHPNEV
jgi:Protein of unknown function (DUF3396)